MSWPAPTRADHQAFCLNEGWREVRSARGKGTHHLTYELTLADGRILRTRVSHPPGRDNYGAAIWAHILRDQLDVTDEEFWVCVRDGVKPQRGFPEVPAEALPLGLVHSLVTKVGLAESEVMAMTKDEAIARLNKFWTENS